jgi:outer membrane protein OmpA-like peptidoglycan-associated protein
VEKKTMFGSYPVRLSPARVAVLREQAQEAAYEAAAAPPAEAPQLVVSRRPIRVLDRFGFDRAALRPEHLKMIEHIAGHVIATWRRGGAVRVIRLVGHADRSGQAGYNVALGRRRAMVVQNRLRARLEQLWPRITQGIRFELDSRGAAEPAVSKRTKDGAALNRRVEVFLTVEKKSP